MTSLDVEALRELAHKEYEIAKLLGPSDEHEQAWLDYTEQLVRLTDDYLATALAHGEPTRWSTGKVDGSLGPIRHASREAAEAWIAERERIDPEGVNAGAYYLDAPESDVEREPDDDETLVGYSCDLLGVYVDAPDPVSAALTAVDFVRTGEPGASVWLVKDGENAYTVDVEGEGAIIETRHVAPGVGRARMKTIEFSERNRSGNLLHVETPLGIVNIRIGLSDALGRRVNAIECLPNRYAGEPEVGLDGYANTRMIEGFEPEPVIALKRFGVAAYDEGGCVIVRAEDLLRLERLAGVPGSYRDAA